MTTASMPKRPLEDPLHERELFANEVVPHLPAWLVPTAVTAQEAHAQLPQPLQLPVGLRL
jgi:hypothetical protein